ncbi:MULTISPECIES: GNAT family N-acetyltransferase [Actinomadura]|uniref:GNAT family N-acetyltransferase n=1 Tax=Actinomadura litoris TaxID=2678616 RepID=A0A7K1LD91_9ACTN|nr:MULTISPECIES: GNAT family N-acetyltransferase [Actinomadura]MBT2208334.1 GNAT family N-acetyltransferase [Actinomadura sp. NEAU-AAG7]MUN42401.1 GNAT family N-acetyltransferase [Actinomadura litoris]
MAAVSLRAHEDVDAARLADLLREAGRAEHDHLPEERVAGYLARLRGGELRCIAAVDGEVVGAAVLYSRFGPLHPIPGGFLRLEGLYVDEVVVTGAWRRHGWSRTLLAGIREVEGHGPDIYIDCDAANLASVAMMGSAGFGHLADYDDPARAASPSRPRTTSLFRHPGRPVGASGAPAKGAVGVE